MGTVITVTSGKGGTGKTSITGAVAASLSLMDRTVLCIDMDIGLRNLDISLGLNDRALMDFSDVALGRCPLARAVVPHPTLKGLSLLTSPMSLPASLTPEKIRALLDTARGMYDYILIDSPAGLGAGFRLAICGADRAVVVATNDASSLRDAQRTVSELDHMRQVHLVMNRIQTKLLRRPGQTGRRPGLLEHRPPSGGPAGAHNAHPVNPATPLKSYQGGIDAMNIAIMSHTKKQDLMVQFCTAYCGVLSKHSVCGTNATGRMVAEATGLPVNLFLSHEHGGIEQIGQRIIYNEIDLVLFFNSPQDNEMDKDVLYITRLCDQHSVPVATNVATAELLIHGLARGDLDWREGMNPNRVPFAL